MNILFLAPQPFYQERGTPIAVKTALEILGSLGHTVSVYTYHEGQTPEIPGCTIYRIPRVFGIRDIRPGFSFKKMLCDAVMLTRIPGMIKRTSPQLIHAVEESVFMGWLAKKVYGIPYVYDMDSSLVDQLVEKYWFLKPLSPFFRFLEKRAVKASVGVIAVCTLLKERVKECSPETPVICLEDMALPRESAAEAESLRKNYGLMGRIVMYIGNLERYQGIDLLIEAFQRTVTRIPDAHLVIIGGTNGDIQQYQARHGSSDKTGQVHFIGSRPTSELYGYLSQADVLVSPRIKGINTPMKIYSYLNSGVPVLATALPTHTQVLDKDTAYLVEPDVEEMSKGLIELLRSDGLGKKLAAAARERAQREYSIPAYRNKLTSFYALIENKVADHA